MSYDYNDRADIHKHLRLRMCNENGVVIKPIQGGVRWYRLDKDFRGLRYYRMDKDGNETYVPDVLVPGVVKRALA